jgi:hypothetical protein
MLRRNRKGALSSELWAWNVEDFSTLKGPLNVQEYIQELIRSDPSNLKKIIEPPKGVDQNIWQYEHMRQFLLELNLLVTQLSESCTPETCPKMKANDWVFTCATHKSGEKDCCAIDYMVHNLDLSTSLLHNTKNFPDRTQITES